jgi:hypothetical protein
VISGVSVRAAQDAAGCEDFTARADVDGMQQDIVGRACQQPDGNWRITQGTPEHPDEDTLIYAPPAYGGYSLDDPWLLGLPLGFAIGTVVFINREHHFHGHHHLSGLAFDHNRNGEVHRGSYRGGGAMHGG